MARLPYVDMASAPEDVRQLVAAAPPLNIFRMLAHAPAVARGFMQLGSAVLGQASLDARLRELAILRVASRSPAPYEWQQHVPIARACGATDDEVAAIERGEIDAGCFDARARALLGLTDALLAGPRPSDTILAGMRQHFSDQEVCEAVITVGYYMLVARFLETTGVDLEAQAGGSVEVLNRLRRES